MLGGGGGGEAVAKDTDLQAVEVGRFDCSNTVTAA